MYIFIILAAIGLVLSAYAYYVEKRKKDKKYKPACDINNKISCTKAFMSKYGKLFGVSNSLLGIVFYLFVILLFAFGYRNTVFYLTLFSVIGSSYLAYLQLFKVKGFCVVCSLIYLVNIFLLLFSIF